MRSRVSWRDWLFLSYSASISCPWSYSFCKSWSLSLSRLEKEKFSIPLAKTVYKAWHHHNIPALVILSALNHIASNEQEYNSHHWKDAHFEKKWFKKMVEMVQAHYNLYTGLSAHFWWTQTLVLPAFFWEQPFRHYKVIEWHAYTLIGHTTIKLVVSGELWLSTEGQVSEI